MRAKTSLAPTGNAMSWDFDLQLHASGAGQNRYICSNMLPFVAQTADAVAGTVDSGAIGIEAALYQSWSFSIVNDAAATAALANCSVIIYGSNDRRILDYWRANVGNPNLPANIVTAFPNSWVQLPGPSEQSGTGSSANPMTETAPFFLFKGSLIAVRAVLAMNASLTGSVRVTAEAGP
jgi:hypothetical protein